ncbi:hypothetical protein DB30_00358 [Enhygromyxa salina]|uniref:Uncharacterized protein n=1 Tax=Enhygromyxa salina TaxID=215803 RepID=A0A0C2CUQ3_9BACT|nr:hypothetical protein [Enhygromyxa salina]KIG13310.1 hypothetical protein DB30_00358 [Enhygromyxa salina]
MATDPHRLAEARSLAAHQLIAARLADEPELLEMARERVASWLEDRSVARAYAEAWRDLLARDVAGIAVAIIDPSEHGRALRQCTPFAGALDPRTRWRLWASVREQLETP